MEDKVQELLDKIATVPTFLGKHYFCRRGCKSFVEEALAHTSLLAEHVRRLKENDYVTLKYVVVPFLEVALNYGKLVERLMETDKAYLALIWDTIKYDIWLTFSYMISAKKDHRQCHGQQATIHIGEFGDVVVEVGRCRKEIPYIHRHEPSDTLRQFLGQQYCLHASENGKTLKCNIDTNALHEVVAAVATWPKARHKLFYEALQTVRPILDSVVKSDKWDFWTFLLFAVDVAIMLHSVEYGLSYLNFSNILFRLESLGLRAVSLAYNALYDMGAYCGEYSNKCYFGQREDLRELKVDCPVDKLGLLELLYREDPMHVYRFLKPRIEEALFQKS